MTPHDCDRLMRTYRSIATSAGAPPRLPGRIIAGPAEPDGITDPAPAPQPQPSGAILAGLLFLVAVEALALAIVLVAP